MDINRALNGLIYTPAAGFQGDDFLTVTVADPEALGDRTAPPPQNIIDDDGGDDGDSGDPPPAAPAGPSPSSAPPPSAAPPALLLSDTKTVVIHVQNAATTIPTPGSPPGSPPSSPPGSPPGSPPPSLLQAILSLYVAEVEKDIGFGDPGAVQQAIDFNARFTVLFGINIAPVIERIADANVASALGGGNA